MGQAEGYGLIAEYFSNGPSLCVVCLSTADELLSHTLLSPLAMDGSSISRFYDPTTKVLCYFLSSIVAPPISNRLDAILISILLHLCHVSNPNLIPLTSAYRIGYEFSLGISKQHSDFHFYFPSLASFYLPICLQSLLFSFLYLFLFSSTTPFVIF